MYNRIQVFIKAYKTWGVIGFKIGFMTYEFSFSFLRPVALSRLETIFWSTIYL